VVGQIAYRTKAFQKKEGEIYDIHHPPSPFIDVLSSNLHKFTSNTRPEDEIHLKDNLTDQI
jgi:hypothetical protein